MWYKVEDQYSQVYISEKLIYLNPDLSADLSADLIISKKKIDYLYLLEIFRNKSFDIILNDFRIDRPYNILNKSNDKIVGCLNQISGRKNKTSTYFILKNKNLFVTKKSENDHNRIGIINQRVLIGEYLIPKLISYINSKNVLRFESILVEYIKFVFDKFEIDGNFLKPEAIDCIPKNTIITSNGFEFFDMEYLPNTKLSKTHFVFRCVISFNKKFIKKNLWPYNSPFELYNIILNQLCIKHNIEKDIENEIEFLNSILTEDSIFLNKSSLKNIFFNSKTSIVERIKIFINKK